MAFMRLCLSSYQTSEQFRTKRSTTVDRIHQIKRNKTKTTGDNQERQSKEALNENGAPAAAHDVAHLFKALNLLALETDLTWQRRRQATATTIRERTTREASEQDRARHSAASRTG
jgi:hypothetical protein